MLKLKSQRSHTLQFVFNGFNVNTNEVGTYDIISRDNQSLCGRYESKERAIEVLFELENWCNSNTTAFQMPMR